MWRRQSPYPYPVILSVILLSLSLGACAAPNGQTSAVATIVPSSPLSTPTLALAEPSATGLISDGDRPTQPPSPIQPTGAASQMPKSLQDLGFSVATYADPTSGLAFDYPSGWILQAPSDEQKQTATIYSISLRSIRVTSAPKQQEGLPEGMTAIDFSVDKQGPKTLTQAINERRTAAISPDNGHPIAILNEEDWILPGALAAHHFLLDQAPSTTGTPGPDRRYSELVTIIKGRMILVSGQGDQSLFESIAASLHETP
jgi:hypothetical protein